MKRNEGKGSSYMDMYTYKAACQRAACPICCFLVCLLNLKGVRFWITLYLRNGLQNLKASPQSRCQAAAAADAVAQPLAETRLLLHLPLHPVKQNSRLKRNVNLQAPGRRTPRQSHACICRILPAVADHVCTRWLALSMTPPPPSPPRAPLSKGGVVRRQLLVLAVLGHLVV